MRSIVLGLALACCAKAGHAQYLDGQCKFPSCTPVIAAPMPPDPAFEKRPLLLGAEWMVDKTIEEVGRRINLKYMRIVSDPVGSDLGQVDLITDQCTVIIYTKSNTSGLPVVWGMDAFTNEMASLDVLASGRCSASLLKS